MEPPSPVRALRAPVIVTRFPPEPGGRQAGRLARCRRRPARRRRPGPASVGMALAAGALLSGCGTLSSYANGCPAPFSGVRTDREYLEDLGGLGNDALRWATVSLDLPLSAVADVLTLPVAALAEAPPPTPVSPGCRWAIPPR